MQQVPLFLMREFQIYPIFLTLEHGLVLPSESIITARTEGVKCEIWKNEKQQVLLNETCCFAVCSILTLSWL